MNISPFRLRWLYLGGGGVVFIVVLLGGMGAGFLAGGIATHRQEQAYAHEGVTAIAEVTNKGSRRSSSGRSGSTTHYWVKYDFRDKRGNSYLGEGDINKSDWEQLKKGSSIRIEYLDSSPKENRPAIHSTGANYTVSYILFAVGGLLLASSLGMFMYFWSHATRMIHLLREGQMALGMVTNMELIRKSKSTSYTLHYSFRDPSGKTLRGTATSLNSSMAARWPVGTPIIVCHDLNDPTQHTLDIHQVWREEREQLMEMLAKQSGGKMQFDEDDAPKSW